VSIIDLADPPCRVTLVRNKRARRFILRLDPGSGGAILTMPPGVCAKQCRDFLTRHSGWLRNALERLPVPVRIADGAEIPIGGVSTPVVMRDGRRRVPMLEDRRLVVQGAGAEGPRVAAWLKLRARDALLPAARAYARKLGRSIERIALRDTSSRWGSCSTSGTLSFSWRLAMAPPEVLDYVAAHEAAHLVEMNHSPAYWAQVGRICPEWEPRRAWLRTHGRALHRYDFTSDGTPAGPSQEKPHV